ncbi:hypothetical protein [Streptomyces sp. NPDC059616]|uniref:hypothetical protein n=1 Tax=Streptomyces sp. NPDC059616 TaxID=3346886 RepID=UPI00369C3274
MPPAPRSAVRPSPEFPEACTGTYRVTAADARRGEVVNRAVATAENGTVRSNQDQARISVAKDAKKPCDSKHDKKCKPKPKPTPKPCHDKHDKHDKKCKPKPKPTPKPCHDKHDKHDKKCKPKPKPKPKPCHGKSICHMK